MQVKADMDMSEVKAELQEVKKKIAAVEAALNGGPAYLDMTRDELKQEKRDLQQEKHDLQQEKHDLQEEKNILLQQQAPCAPGSRPPQIVLAPRSGPARPQLCARELVANASVHAPAVGVRLSPDVVHAFKPTVVV